MGALVERGMSCLFSPGGITKVFFPKDHSTLPGLAFMANVSNRLSFLKLDFVLPAVVIPPIASFASLEYSFPCLKLDFMLWHRCFGHLGMDATRAALTKEYVTGVNFDGPRVRALHRLYCW